MKSPFTFVMACMLLVLGCTKSSSPAAARQNELDRILKPYLASTEIDSDGYSEIAYGWYDPTNQSPLRNFIARYPDTEEACEAEVWLSLGTAPVSSQMFSERRRAAELAERLKIISGKTSCPGTEKMAELERAFVLYQEWPGNHTDFYRQVDDIITRIQDFKSEKSGPFRRYLRAMEMKPSEIEPNLRYLVVREKCCDHMQDEALALAKELKQKYPNWESRSVNAQIEMIELYQKGWTPTPQWSHGSIAQE